MLRGPNALRWNVHGFLLMRLRQLSSTCNWSIRVPKENTTCSSACTCSECAGFLSGGSGFVTFFRRVTTPFAIRPLLPKDLWCTTRETTSYIIRGCEPRFSVCGVDQITGLFFTRVEVDLTRCEATSLARPQEPTTSIKCGTRRLLSVNSVMLSTLLLHETARHE